MYEFLSTTEGEQMDAKALDKIGIKKFGDMSLLNTEMSDASGLSKGKKKSKNKAKMEVGG